MKLLKLSMGVLFALLLAFSTAQSAFAGGWDLWCDGQNGTWSGVDSFTGNCTFESSDFYFQENSPCDDDQLWILYYIEEFDHEECVELGSGSPGSGSPVSSLPKTYSHNSAQGDEAADLCTQAGGTWRCGYFNAGTCAVNCYIDPHLPGGAQSALPGGAISTLYVNISPDPGGSYTVCFANPGNESLTIYQYLGGGWVALTTSTGNPICASASGDGSFYLGS